jgi:hypothetical protein
MGRDIARKPLFLPSFQNLEWWAFPKYACNDNEDIGVEHCQHCLDPHRTLAIADFRYALLLALRIIGLGLQKPAAIRRNGQTSA